MRRAEVAEILLGMEADGPLTPARIIEEAADPNHPLHERFEWDDSIAGHQHRLHQARMLLLTIKLTPKGAAREIRLYMHVPSPGGEGEYVRTELLVKQPSKWQLAKQETLGYLTAAQDSVDEMEEAYRVFHGGPSPDSSRRLRRAKRSIKAAQSELSAVA